jgi:hypothetical protein
MDVHLLDNLNTQIDININFPHLLRLSSEGFPAIIRLCIAN